MISTSRNLQGWAGRTSLSRQPPAASPRRLPRSRNTRQVDQRMPASSHLHSIYSAGRAEKGAGCMEQRRSPSAVGFVPRAGVLLSRHSKTPKSGVRDGSRPLRPLHAETPAAEEPTFKRATSLRCPRDATDRAGADEACRGCVKPRQGLLQEVCVRPWCVLLA